ncbi:MAG: hypothetical protein IMZ50_06755 [Candidatus Atribacteria bacterium]|nr:hypothetical protein [Candidatus Atribacteria bacterium]
MSIIGALIGALILTYLVWCINGRPSRRYPGDYIVAGLGLWALRAALAYLATT